MQLTLEDLRKDFKKAGYICDEETVLTVYLSLVLEKPILIEGPPGVGKTEMGKVLAQIFDTELIRLQCYEGLDENKALYEWNYQKQLLKIQIGRRDAGAGQQAGDLFSTEYLLERPLLRAIQAPRKAVLLVDEIDKSDDEFEAFLFEVLSDFQVSIPELGTIKANHIPIVVLTSNSERELSDGLKRRCVFLYLDFPGIEKEVEIIQAKVPQAGDNLTKEIARAVNLIRKNAEIRKKPSIAETLDWTRALVSLNKDRLQSSTIELTLNLLLKNRADQRVFQEQIGARNLWEKSRSSYLG
ncbi:MAG: MoxR family ATPase [Firmicutes bacterium]|nr:MoxR family ATPase [Bacillota bacterium]